MTMTNMIVILIIAVSVALAIWLWMVISDPLGDQRDNAAKEWEKRRSQLLADEGERYGDEHRNLVAPDPVELHRARKTLTEAKPVRATRKYSKN